ncbi:MAG: patatin-like phospholipase family protein [candidate division Zixibacteria bacterium]|nr:patatin-like phospholipase family protein [candidate division Zixibacteria bacterium]
MSYDTKDSLKIGIALSGGGIRAAVFHLGVLARLAEDGLLEQFAYLSSVSGGSLVTGLIYSLSCYKWPDSEKFKSMVFRKARHTLTSTNIQRDSLFRLLTKPQYIFQGKAKLISESLKKRWRIDKMIHDIPVHPRWAINATTYETGKNWRFIPERMGDYIVKYTPNPKISLSDAIAASAAYPGLIGPLKLKTSKYKWFKFGKDKKLSVSVKQEDKLFHLWDGGVYDNLGTEALYKPGKDPYHHKINFLLISDASKSLENEKSMSFYKRAFRLVNISMDQVRSLRSRQLASHFIENDNTGAYLKMGYSPESIFRAWKMHPSNEPALIGDALDKSESDRAANYATTLKRISENDFDLIARHGWEVANYTLLALCPNLFKHKKWVG